MNKGIQARSFPEVYKKAQGLPKFHKGHSYNAIKDALFEAGDNRFKVVLSEFRKISENKLDYQKLLVSKLKFAELM